MRRARPPRDWPNADLSRFVDTRRQRWHVQRIGAGPKVLLLHGAGASLHSWRDMLRPIGAFADALALDLPGQGYTEAKVPGRFGLNPMAEDISALLEAEGFRPDLTVGHSAGGAIALWMAAADLSAPAQVLGLNPALMPFQGVAGLVFPPLAKLLAMNPLTAHFFARAAASPMSVRNLIEGTGSHVSEAGLEQYRTLIADHRHVDGALRMMASWNLDPLLAALPDIAVPATFAIGQNDKAVPPDTTRRQAARMPNARVLEYPGQGHLMHEETPEVFVSLVRRLLRGGE